MWYLAILVAFGVSTVTGQVDRLDCRLVGLSPFLFPGARTLTTASLSQEEICRCFDNSLIYRPTDRFVARAVNTNGETVVFNGTIAQLCNPLFRQQGLRFIFSQGSTDNRLTGFVIRDGVVIADTAESDVISLRTSQDYHTITNNVTHSAGMIAITSILPILFALLLAIFSSMLFMRCCCCQVFTPTKCQQDT
ncbi:hypothetical protein GDO78_019586 [Eleutherodactylus coqui]|uniref:Uncharacterized protein n=1 Tax=Eleutherodactylus coqui TaxID=57060 RepID=A0A8J6B7M1_ELECQ|nr:hypothetical protein GDO78_019586 [Eleutherodactylus coqui]